MGDNLAVSMGVGMEDAGDRVFYVILLGYSTLVVLNYVYDPVS